MSSAEGISATMRSSEMSGRAGHREPVGQGAEARRDRVHRRVGQGDGGGGQTDGDDQAREAGEGAAQGDDEDECGERDNDGRNAQGVAGGPEDRDLFKEVGGNLAGVETEKVAELARRDDDRDADGEAVDHRFGDVLDQIADTQPTRREQDEAGHQRGDHEAVVAVDGDDREDHDDEGARRPADLHLAAAEQRDHEPADDRGDEPCGGRRAGGDGDCQTEGQGDHRDRDARNHVPREVRAAVAVKRAQDDRAHGGCLGLGVGADKWSRRAWRPTGGRC